MVGRDGDDVGSSGLGGVVRRPEPPRFTELHAAEDMPSIISGFGEDAGDETTVIPAAGGSGKSEYNITEPDLDEVMDQEKASGSSSFEDYSAKTTSQFRPAPRVVEKSSEDVAAGRLGGTTPEVSAGDFMHPSAPAVDPGYAVIPDDGSDELTPEQAVEVLQRELMDARDDGAAGVAEAGRWRKITGVVGVVAAAAVIGVSVWAALAVSSADDARDGAVRDHDAASSSLSKSADDLADMKRELGRLQDQLRAAQGAAAQDNSAELEGQVSALQQQLEDQSRALEQAQQDPVVPDDSAGPVDDGSQDDGSGWGDSNPGDGGWVPEDPSPEPTPDPGTTTTPTGPETPTPPTDGGESGQSDTQVTGNESAPDVM